MLLNYIQIKYDYYAQPHVKLNIQRNQRSLWAQIRTRTLPLATEESRYKDISFFML